MKSIANASGANTVTAAVTGRTVSMYASTSATTPSVGIGDISPSVANVTPTVPGP